MTQYGRVLGEYNVLMVTVATAIMLRETTMLDLLTFTAITSCTARGPVICSLLATCIQRADHTFFPL